ncbi:MULTISPECIES: glycosyltransferase family protein [Actinomyces]|uniref:Glycosyl transferase family 28 n=1 Tax=Actinomyces oris TaxID=544580 RepID=A0A1Q8VHB9_9ACTO|nr:glycosyltransferase [Actinomyces oris]OLO47467.1 glycosyl transferase family 28 [Actinomyces oris]
MTTVPLRVALYSHDAKGLGHFRRNLALAHHLARALPGLTGRDVTGLVVTGLTPGQEYRLPDGFDWLVLPGVKKSGGTYLPQRLRITREDLSLVRSALLSGALSTFAPDLFIIDRHPYGVYQELREPLAHLRRAHPAARVVLGLREVLDTPATVQREWDALGDTGTLRRLIDEVWVYGDAAVHDLSATGEAPAALEERMRYTGYLAHGRDIAEARDGSEASAALAGNALDPEPFILTTAGGGSDGINLLRAAAEARVPDGYRHVVVTGPQLDAALFHQVAQAAGPRTVVRRSWPGMSRHIQQAAAVVSMAGYNTVSEILASDTPALLVPRETPRLEQFIRATALKEAGAVDLLRVTDLSAAALENRLTVLLRDQNTARHQLMGRRRLRLDGLTTVPLLAAELVGDRNDGPTTRLSHLASHATSLTRMEIPA